MSFWLPLLLSLFATAFCIARLVVEVRAKRWWWASAAAVSAFAILATPMPVVTHTVKIDLPSN
ncbi:hypothetical protein J2Y54_000641 [Sphingomonas sp. BE123]|jgi:hypothetical protein|uniref:hypothetical protein n=1 Tax=Sphingomonas sp. BE123 TaxID=2817842 RepID=UPI00285D6F96|nr:hypothetical protein [Sphingomonas sp. BE123]MDR6851148.1 hypothetical protein [Sphingomonas sp. BE123]